MRRVFLEYGTLLMVFPSFKYLERTFLSSKDDWKAVEHNLKRSQEKWVQLANILVREGLDRRTVGRFYLAVVQAVILFGSATWVLTPRLEKSLEVFHHRAVWRMAGMGPKRQWYGTWVYTPIEAALAMVGLEEIGAYIDRRQNTITQ